MYFIACITISLTFSNISDSILSSTFKLKMLFELHSYKLMFAIRSRKLIEQLKVVERNTSK